MVPSLCSTDSGSHEHRRKNALIARTFKFWIGNSCLLREAGLSRSRDSILCRQIVAKPAARLARTAPSKPTSVDIVKGIKDNCPLKKFTLRSRFLSATAPQPALGTFQGLILALQQFWAAKGCVLMQPLDMEVGAGTFHPATFL